MSEDHETTEEAPALPPEQGAPNGEADPDPEERGFFLPEAKRGRMELTTPVSRPALIATLLLGGASCVLMVLGGGHAVTWIGAVLFAAFMAAFAAVSNRGVERQNKRIADLLSEDDG